VLFGMTRGEIGLTLFIFALVFGSGFVSRAGERLGAWMAKRRGG
jgi:hypothetical protein